MNVLKKLMGGAYKIASTEIAVKNGLGKAVTLDTLPMGFKFSTSEQWTGQYWIDGTKIYTITFVINKNNVAHGISKLNNVLSVSAIYNRGNTYGQSDGSDDVTIQSANIYLTGNIATYISSGATITLEYTCTNR